jgi:chromosome segregation ATPase
MNNPIRYNLNTVVGIVDEDECGKYVLYSDYEQLKEGNECLNAFHDKEMARSAYLLEEFNRTTAWGRGLESDLSHARVEISFLKAEVERLSAADSYLQSANEHSFEQRCDELEAEVERLNATMEKVISTADKIDEQNQRLRKAGDALAEWMDVLGAPRAVPFIDAWNAAKEGKPSV